jgi:hypothetical protein
LKHKKITLGRPYLRDQLNVDRASDMKVEITNQLNLFKQRRKGERFIFVEVGSFMGESLELFGNAIHESLKENYLIISIDPYVPWSKLADEENSKTLSVGGAETLNDKLISKVYYFFINNISVTKFKNNFIHLRMTSKEAFNLISSLNLFVDFCYIDAGHLYEDIKCDYTNYNLILKNYENYSGMICGDDYEYSVDELMSGLSMDRVVLIDLLKQYKNADYISLKNEYGFHPGMALFFSERDDKIKKYGSGFWAKENNEVDNSMNYMV